MFQFLFIAKLVYVKKAPTLERCSIEYNINVVLHYVECF